MNRREARQYAKYRAGMILDSVLADGWFPDDLVRELGPETVDLIREEITVISQSLMESGRTLSEIEARRKRN